MADANYDANVLYDMAGHRGVQLIAKRRYKKAKGLGHHRHSPHRLAALDIQQRDPKILESRRRIEGHFGTMATSLAGWRRCPTPSEACRV